MLNITSNLPSWNALRHLQGRSRNLNTSQIRLSSGKRINSAADDAAGLSIATRINAQIRSHHQARANVQDGILLSRTAAGALQEVNKILQRMRELSVQAASDTLTANDRLQLQQEFNQLRQELDEIARQTSYNKQPLLDGSSGLLASTNSDLLKVISTGSSNISNIPLPSGEYLLEMETEAGLGQVQNSHIMSLMNGSRATDIRGPKEGEYTGLTSFSATGLALGDYRIQTREMPFGGIFYLDTAGAEIPDPTALGINTVRTSSTPNIMPYGEYAIETANRVPFMATFADFENPGDHGFTDDIIRGVRPSNLAPMDVSMDIRTGVSAVGAETQLGWKDIGVPGGGTILLEPPGPQEAPAATEISVNTKDGYDINTYTHFRVVDDEERMELENEIQAATYYRSVVGSQIDVQLTYQSNPNSQMAVEATYQTQAGESITAQTTYFFAAGRTVTIEVDGTTETIDISNMHMEEARATLNGTLGLTFIIVDDTGTKRIQVENNTGHEAVISDDGADDLGISGTLSDGGEFIGTDHDFNREHTFNVGNRDITELASVLNFGGREIQVTAENQGDGTYQLQLESTGNYHLELIDDPAPDSVETELGLNGVIIDPGSNWSGNNVFHEHSININLEHLTLPELATAIEDAIWGENVAGASIEDVTIQDVDAGANRRRIELANDSIYQLSFDDITGETGQDLNLLLTLQARGTTATSHQAFHEHTITVDVGDERIDGISQALNTALGSALTGDDLDNNTAEPFSFVEHGDGTASIHIENDETRYQLTTTDRTHETAADLLLHDETIHRDDTLQPFSGLHYGQELGIIDPDQDMEEVYAAVDSLAGWIHVG